MAASVTGTFTIIDRASGPMRKMELQALATDAAVNKLGDDLDEIGSQKQQRRMQGATRAFNDMERASKAVRQETSRTTTEVDRFGRSTTTHFTRLRTLVSSIHSGWTSFTNRFRQDGSLLQRARTWFRDLRTALAPLEGLFGGLAKGAGGLVGGLQGLATAFPPLISLGAIATPVIIALAGAVTALAGSLGLAVGGAALVGGGLLGAFVVGVGSIAAAVAPAISKLTDLRTAQANLNKAIATGAAPSTIQTYRKQVQMLKQQAPGIGQLSDELQKFIDRWNKLAKPAQASFFRTVRDVLRDIKGLLPEVAREAEKNVDKIHDVWNKILGPGLQSRGFQQFLRDLGRIFRANLPGFARGLTHLGDALHNMLHTAMPFLTRIGSGFNQWMKQFDQFTRSKRGQQFVHQMIHAFSEWGRLLGSVLHLFFAVLKSSGQGTSIVGGWADAINGLANRLERNPNILKDWFASGFDWAGKLMRVLRTLVDTLDRILPALNKIAGAIGDITDNLGSTGLLTLLGGYVGYRALRGARRGATRVGKRLPGGERGPTGAPTEGGMRSPAEPYGTQPGQIGSRTPPAEGGSRLGGMIRRLGRVVTPGTRLRPGHIGRKLPLLGPHIAPKTAPGEIPPGAGKEAAFAVALNLLFASGQGGGLDARTGASALLNTFDPTAWPGFAGWGINTVGGLFGVHPNIPYVPSLSNLLLYDIPASLTSPARGARMTPQSRAARGQKHPYRQAGTAGPQGFQPLPGMPGAGAPAGPAGPGGQVTGQMSSFADRLGNIFDRVGSRIKRALTGPNGLTNVARNVGKTLGDTLGGGPTSIVSTVAKALGGLFGNKKGQPLDLASAMGRGISSVFDALTGNVGDASQKTHDRTLGWWQKIVDGVGKQTGAMNRSTSSGLDQLLSDTANALSKLGVRSDTPLAGGTASGAPVRGKHGQKVGAGAATGMRIPGMGRQDTVNVGYGTMAAPGELIVNRHTEKRIDGMLAAFGTRLGAEVAGEDRPHYMAKGGRQGRGSKGMTAGGAANFGGHPANVSPQIRNFIGTMQANFPLMVTATTDGSHVSGSYHYSGEAVDMSAAPSVMLKASDYIKRAGIYRSLQEGIHNPNLSVAGGKMVDPSYYASVWASHADHIHAAITGAFQMGAAAGAMKAPQIALPHARGAGRFGQIGQGALNRVHGAAQHKVNQAFGRMGVMGDAKISAGGTYDLRELEQLWLRAGGTKGMAHIMGAVALAESGGNPQARNPSGASGLWQIMMPANQTYVHGSVWNPMVNARAAVEIFGAQGLGAWEAYTNGAYRQYMARGGRVPSFAGWFAQGGQITADRPTLVGLGEGGRKEKATITSAVDSAGRPAHGVHIGHITIQNHRPGDIKQQIKDEVGQAFKELGAELDIGAELDDDAVVT